MARMHGAEVRVYLGDRDVGGDLTSIAPAVSADTHEVTNFSSNGWKQSVVGLVGWTASIEGFYDPAVDGYGRQLSDLLGATGGILSIFDGDADAVGKGGWLGSEAILTERSESVSVADLVKLSGVLQGAGRAGMDARLLHPHGQESASDSGSSVDNSAASANGGRANLHVTAATGRWAVKIEHSTDNSTWADLVAFSSINAGTSFTKEVSGQVNRYLRARWTEGAAGSVTFVLGFARY
ncbi:MAG: hypothetical protein OXG46_04160 [Chloroflexi bacterium]|nr:hypothetical protein [Chloroflexota bacterium]MCY3938644.1 hypothetical protein [Chloroflexota bacterium]